MTLEDALLKGSDLSLVCGACDTQTTLAPQFFAQRYDLTADLGAIAKGLVCPACGADNVELIVLD